MSFRSIFESIMKSLDEKDGLVYPRPSSMKFLKNAVFFNENGVIEESLDVFPSSMFRKTLALIDDVHGRFKAFSQAEFVATIEAELPSKPLITDDAVIVMKSNLKLYSELISCFSGAFDLAEEKLQADPDFKAFYEHLFNDGACAVYVNMEDRGKDYSLIIIDRNKVNQRIVRHEMIHWLQHMFGVWIVKNAKYLKINASSDTYGLIQSEKLPAVFSRTEMVPYIHDVCYVLEDHNIATVDEALEVFDKFIEFDGDSLAYISRCKSMPEYAWFKGEPTPVHMLMLAVVHGRNLKVFKATIAKYFSLKEKER